MSETQECLYGPEFAVAPGDQGVEAGGSPFVADLPRRSAPSLA